MAVKTWAAGEVLTAADLNDTIADARGALAPRNLLYNGAMQVHQRGTSSTGITAAGYYTADRHQTLLTGLGTWTQSIENDAPTGSGFRKSLKMLCTTADSSPAAGDFLRFEQRLEGQNLQIVKKGTSAAEQLTVSFWVKSNVTGTYCCGLVDADNTRHVGSQYTIEASGTWEKKTITFPADTTGAFDNDNAYSLALTHWLGAGTDRSSGTLPSTWLPFLLADSAVGQTNLAAATSNYWQVTGVQLEVGAAATQFEFKPYGQELLECQRYYEKSYSSGVAAGTNTETGMVQSMNGVDGNQILGIRWITTKRAAPTVNIYSKTGSASTVSNTSLNDSGANDGSWSTVAGVNEHGFRALVGTGGLTSGTAYNFHYVASAEL